MKDLDFNQLVKDIGSDHTSDGLLGDAVITKIDRWFTIDSQDSHKLEELLVLLQQTGLDKRSANILFPRIRHIVLTCEDEDVLVPALWLVSDMMAYIKPDMSVVNRLIGSHSQGSRAYKLAKSTLLSKLMTTKGQHTDKINAWMKRIFTGDDREYMDVLAFAVANEGVVISDDLVHIFREHITSNKLADESAEMAVSLARIKDPFIQDYIIEALSDGPGDPWVEAAILYNNSKIQKVLKDKVDKSRIEELSVGLD